MRVGDVVPLVGVHSCADVSWTFDPHLELKQHQRAVTMKSVSRRRFLAALSCAAAELPPPRIIQVVQFFTFCRRWSSAVAPLFKPPVASVKIDLGKIKPFNTFLTQLPQSERSPRGKKGRKRVGS